MADDRPIEIGDRVIHLQVRGIFTVTGRRGRLVDITSDAGLRLSVYDVGLRRVDGTPPAAAAP